MDNQNMPFEALCGNSWPWVEHGAPIAAHMLAEYSPPHMFCGSPFNSPNTGDPVFVLILDYFLVEFYK